MPQRKPVKKLAIFTTTYVGDIICKFLGRHDPSNCKYCINTFMNEDCLDLITLKENLAELPVTTRISLHGETLPKIPWMPEPCDRYEKLYFHTWLFESRELRLNYVSLDAFTDYYFMKKFASNVEKIIYPSVWFSRNCFRRIVYQSTNLRTIYISTIRTEDIFEIVGNNCHQLKSITGIICESLSILSSYLKLLFKDPEFRTEKNVCSNTLEVINVTMRNNNISTETMNPLDDAPLVESLKTLFLNVPHLKAVGKQYSVIHCLEARDKENGVVVKIETGWCPNLTVNTIESIKNFWPHLRTIVLNTNSHTVEILQHVSSITSIRNLDLKVNTELIQLNQGLLHSIWNNILSVNLDIVGIWVEFDLSEFAKKLPNLEDLKIENCRGNIVWDNISYFRVLKNVSISFDYYHPNCNFNWITSCSECVKKLEFSNRSSFERYFQLRPLLGRVYSNLEIFSTYSMEFDTDTVMTLIDSSPVLKKLGYFLVKEEDMSNVELVLKYVEENNFDCEIEYQEID